MPAAGTARTLLAYAAAVLTAAALGSIAQTQFNLAAIQGLGVELSPAVRLRTTGHDLVGFAPRYAALVAVALLVALPLAELLARWAPRWRGALVILAGGASVLAAIVVLNAALPMTPIAATRYAAGTAVMSAAGALGGLAYLAVRGRMERPA
jgi:hypothetical protein